MVGVLEAQLVKCLFKGVYARKIKVDCVKNLVVSNAALYNIILRVGQSLTASSDIIKPFTIVCVKDYAREIR